jgi:hypothetical protein
LCPRRADGLLYGWVCTGRVRRHDSDRVGGPLSADTESRGCAMTRYEQCLHGETGCGTRRAISGRRACHVALAFLRLFRSGASGLCHTTIPCCRLPRRTTALTILLNDFSLALGESHDEPSFALATRPPGRLTLDRQQGRFGAEDYPSQRNDVMCPCGVASHWLCRCRMRSRSARSNETYHQAIEASRWAGATVLATEKRTQCGHKPRS